jgi:protein-L-isoaspartate O-methyltransferase
VAAILGRLAAQVVTVVPTLEIAERARRRLETLGLTNVEVAVGASAKGYPKNAPYDGILLTNPNIDISPELQEQLGDGGHLAALSGSADQILLVTRHGEKFAEQTVTGLRMAHVIGDLLVETRSSKPRGLQD